MSHLYRPPFGGKHHIVRDRLEFVGTLGFRRRYRHRLPFTTEVWRIRRRDLGVR